MEKRDIDSGRQHYSKPGASRLKTKSEKEAKQTSIPVFSLFLISVRVLSVPKQQKDCLVVLVIHAVANELYESWFNRYYFVSFCGNRMRTGKNYSCCLTVVSNDKNIGFLFFIKTEVLKKKRNKKVIFKGNGKLKKTRCA